MQRWLPREELSVLQHVIVLIGQNCNPVSSAKDHGLQVKLEYHAHVLKESCQGTAASIGLGTTDPGVTSPEVACNASHNMSLLYDSLRQKHIVYIS